MTVGISYLKITPDRYSRGSKEKNRGAVGVSDKDAERGPLIYRRDRQKK